MSTLTHRRTSHALAFQVPEGSHPWDIDEIASQVAAIAAWPSSEGTSALLERRLVRASGNGPLTELMLFALRDTLPMLRPADAQAELEELARPLRERNALVRVDEEALALPIEQIGYVIEMTKLHKLIPEGLSALAPLFTDLAHGLSLLDGAVGLSLIISTADVDADVFEESVDEQVRGVLFSMRIFSHQALPATLRARAHALCQFGRARSESWSTAQRQPDVIDAVDAIANFEIAPRAATTHPRLAALMLGLPLARAGATKRGRPFTGQLDTTGALLGELACDDGNVRGFRLSWERRRHHVAIFGSSGCGKSVQLARVVNDDVENGRAAMLIDPHGDLVREAAKCIPPERLVLIDPRSARSAQFSLLDPSPIAASATLASAFREVWPRGWVGPAGERGLSHALEAVHASSLPDATWTVVTLMRFIGEPDFRTEIINAITDPDVKRMVSHNTRAWNQAGSEGHPFNEWLASKLTPLASGPARSLFDRESEQTLEQQIADRKIVLVALPIGVLGDSTTRIVGRMLLTRVATAVASQGALAEADRREVSVIVDEAHLLVGDAMRGLFSQIRKFAGSVAIGTQSPSQLGPGLDELLTNVQTVFTGRLSRRESMRLADRLGLDAVASLPRLPRHHMLVSLEDTDPDLPPYVMTPIPVPADPHPGYNHDLVNAAEPAPEHGVSHTRTREPVAGPGGDSPDAAEGLGLQLRLTGL